MNMPPPQLSIFRRPWVSNTPWTAPRRIALITTKEELRRIIKDITHPYMTFLQGDLSDK